MTVEYISSTSSSGGTTPSLPSGTTEGDGLLLAVMFHELKGSTHTVSVTGWDFIGTISLPRVDRINISSSDGTARFVNYWDQAAYNQTLWVFSTTAISGQTAPSISISGSGLVDRNYFLHLLRDETGTDVTFQSDLEVLYTESLDVDTARHFHVNGLRMSSSTWITPVGTTTVQANVAATRSPYTANAPSTGSPTFGDRIICDIATSPGDVFTFASVSGSGHSVVYLNSVQIIRMTPGGSSTYDSGVCSNVTVTTAYKDGLGYVDLVTPDPYPEIEYNPGGSSEEEVLIEFVVWEPVDPITPNPLLYPSPVIDNFFVSSGGGNLGNPTGTLTNWLLMQGFDDDLVSTGPRFVDPTYDRYKIMSLFMKGGDSGWQWGSVSG